MEADSVNLKRLGWVLGSEAAAYGTSMIWLYQAWYKGYDHSSFHFFDDSGEWLQMDKAGHFYSSYYFDEIITSGFRWAGMKGKKGILWGSGLAMLYISSIEVFDGFSSKWGASATDLAANAGGIGIYTTQALLWKEQRIIPKFSFSRSGLAKYRPDALGSNFSEELLKDYNGQTYWLSFNLKSLTKIKWMPAWLNVAAGYGADGMLGGESNDPIIAIDNSPVMRKREYYFSLDADLTKIRTQHQWLKVVFAALNTIKVPFPAISYDKENKWRGRGIGF
jgi:hypothetical protein